MQYCMGVDIGGTKCAVLLGKARLEEGEDSPILKRLEFPTKTAGGPQGAIEKICEGIQALLDEYRLSKEQVAGIGISCGGPLDSKKGLILSPPNLPGWDRIPICQILSERFGIPAALENDANACAVAEWKFGAGQGAQNMVFITFGTGCGAGLILDGRLYQGENGMAGEIGHMRLSHFGPVGYGKAGSMEGFCSGGGIAELARMKVLEYLQAGREQHLCADRTQLDQLTAKSVALAAREGDPLAKEIYAISGRYLGKGLAVLIDLLNPSLIVIGSVFARSRDLLWPEAEKVILEESLAASAGVCRVVPAALGDRIGDYAALSLGIYRFCGGNEDDTEK